ncbi:AbiV family abortive infection protein [Crossiella sp. SN42]|uniref:AbiV family abortive infection protein n=1 Tax=Crossiella sp. SN42 TaxID=2944808 RepID=UPI00207CDEFD|nr:AbiV family abortive infection protein [Crossiella sp. SN42]MCO1580442.1 AbiV family abortive infection protein [Crossiella sp. SN42]
MARPRLPDLEPQQVRMLYDLVLANADQLLSAAELLLKSGKVGLARSLAILGLEESGKAIAIHERRVAIAFCPEGEPFVNAGLRNLWSNHRLKLMAVRDFLVREQHWFATNPPQPHELLLGETDVYLETLETWAKEDDEHKQRGFYVDVDPATGNIHRPSDAQDEEAVRGVLAAVHQIGWQLRLADHIEAKGQQDVADAGGTILRNDSYRLRLPDDAELDVFATLGQLGYEAQTRELLHMVSDIEELRKDSGPAADV